MPAANNGGSPITHYVIQVHEDEDGTPAVGSSGWAKAGSSMSTTFTFSGIELSTTLDKLTAEEEVWFRVFAINSVNKSALDADPYIMGSARRG